MYKTMDNNYSTIYSKDIIIFKNINNDHISTRFRVWLKSINVYAAHTEQNTLR